MTQDEIEHMWKVASNDPHHDTNWHDPVVIAFADFVAAKEREACANLCWKDEGDNAFINSYNGKRLDLLCAELIRARGEQA